MTGDQARALFAQATTATPEERRQLVGNLQEQRKRVEAAIVVTERSDAKLKDAAERNPQTQRDSWKLKPVDPVPGTLSALRGEAASILELETQIQIFEARETLAAIDTPTEAPAA